MTQTLSNLQVSYTYHQHTDNNGNVTNSNYLTASGGCYTRYADVNETIQVVVTSCKFDPGADQWNSWGNCYRCGEIWTGPNDSTGVVVNHTHSLGKYYLRNCGKTTETIESATIIY